MNERIKQLWEQAGEEIEAEYEDESRRNRRLYNEIFLPKFAELIVRECVGVVEGGRFLHEQAPTAVFARECSGAIKRHFGVEE